jgi:putative phosphoribosyl transferase
MTSHARDLMFRDRQDAGVRLAQRLSSEGFTGDAIVLGLPRGGVPVAYEIAVELKAPLDVFLVRKLGAPFNPELAVGAIASGGEAVYNEGLLAQLGLDEEALAPILKREEEELERRERVYRRGRPAPSVAGKTVILVDDGVATGATMLAAVDAVRALGPRRVVVAVPSTSASALARLRRSADEVIALSTPEPYVAVGAWYESFPQLSDRDVIEFLDRPIVG